MIRFNFYLALLASIPAVAYNFPSEQIVSKTKLTLNGAGTKEATFLEIKIYDVALYLTEKSSDPTHILSSKTPALVSLHFRISVTGKKLGRSWLEDLYHACPEPDSQLMKEAQALSKQLPDIDKGNIVSYEIFGSQVSILVNNKKLGDIKDNSTRKCVLSAFIGEGMRDQRLKQKLLGL